LIGLFFYGGGEPGDLCERSTHPKLQSQVRNLGGVKGEVMEANLG
jgi:hypothetical protein